MALAEGQVWTFKDATAETARVLIQKIEPWSAESEAVHVSVYGLPEIPGRFAGVITHMPFARAAIDASVERLMDEKAPEGLSIAEGYQDWQENKGGVFTLTVAEAAKYVLDTALTGRVVG